VAWQGALHLDAYGRGHLVAAARANNLPLPSAAVPLFGLLLTIGGVSLVTGLFPVAGTAMIWSALVPPTFLLHRFWRIGDPPARAVERRKFVRSMVLAMVALSFLLVPRPWPMAVGG
jgi:hypothetical protein